MKAESHAELTQIAIDLFLNQQDCRLTELLSNGKYAKALIKGSVREDALSKHRLTQWHFYPANSALAAKVMGSALNPTSRQLMQRRQRELLSAAEQELSSSLFETLGRLLHHVRDMSTPSHVTPVFHGKLRPDPYETYLKSE